MRRPDVAILFAASAAMFLAATGCRSSPLPAQAADAAPSVFAQQLIVKFKPDTLNCDTESIARLSQVARVPLEFVRVMSGDGCVIRQTADSRDGLEQGQETLRQHPAVEWLERDAKIRAY